VWKARERGRLLERVKALRLVKDVWVVWISRVQDKKYLEGWNVVTLILPSIMLTQVYPELAQAFSLRSNSCIASSAYQTWCQVRATHQNAQFFAAQYHAAQLCFKTLLNWRVRLREKLKMTKRARMAGKKNMLRRSWGIWMHELHEKRREKMLNDLEMRKQQNLFYSKLSC
jgi:hypothetical protein